MNEYTIDNKQQGETQARHSEINLVIEQQLAYLVTPRTESGIERQWWAAKNETLQSTRSFKRSPYRGIYKPDIIQRHGFIEAFDLKCPKECSRHVETSVLGEEPSWTNPRRTKGISNDLDQDASEYSPSTIPKYYGGIWPVLWLWPQVSLRVVYLWGFPNSRVT